MIKIEEVKKSYYNCNQCYDDYKNLESSPKLYNVVIGNDKATFSTRLCCKCLRALKEEIDKL